MQQKMENSSCRQIAAATKKKRLKKSKNSATSVHDPCVVHARCCANSLHARTYIYQIMKEKSEYFFF